jgi:rhodanese-related sulfurtransferase
VQFLIESWYLFAIALVSGTLLLWPSLRGGMSAGGVSCSDAVQLMNRQRAVVIDVREAAEFVTGHVVSSKNIPIDQLEASKQLPKNKTLPVVLVCETGASASKGALMLRKLGFDNAHSLAGGLNAWRTASYPLEKLG